MGRYYNGDIDGKFWFGVQSSDDASFFGGEEIEPNYIEYRFDKEDDMEKVKLGLTECEKEMGENYQKLEDFFNTHEMYSDTELSEKTGIPMDTVSHYLTWYARYKLGKKIHDHLDEHGSCEFQAEL